MAKQIMLYGEIGYEVTAKGFLEELRALQPDDEIAVRINSPGGNIVGGFAIYNQLLSNPRRKTAYIDSLCGSIASVILMAFDRVVMPENSWIVIHCPNTSTMGGADDLRTEADLLDRFDEAIRSAYMRRCTIPEEELRAKMEAETWLSAAEAKAMGFCDEIVEPVKAAAKVSISAKNFKAIPERARASFTILDAPAQPPQPKKGVSMEKFLALLQEMGFTVGDDEKLCEEFKAKLAVPPPPAPQAVIPAPFLDRIGAAATDSVDAVMGRFDAMLACAGQASAQVLAAKDAEVASATLRAEIAEARAAGILSAVEAEALAGKTLDYVRANIQATKAHKAMPATTAPGTVTPEAKVELPDGVCQADFDGYMAYIAKSPLAQTLWAKSNATDRKAFVEGWKRRNPSKSE